MGSRAREARRAPDAAASRRSSRPKRARQHVINWIDATWKIEARRNDGDPGPVLARRLSNAEYNYTIHDLTGVDIRPAREFPVDPANLAGFDNSGESLTMSPALLTKYLQAARLVADHMFLNPEGFEFAPHPMLVETDREKFCIQQIVDFYDRQATDYADYFRAAWLYKHRAVLGKPKATLADIAAQNRVSARYLTTIWQALEERRKRSGRSRSCRRCGARCLCRRRRNQTEFAATSSIADARLRRAHAQGHVAEVREPGREGIERRDAAAHELEEPAVRDAPPRFRARGAARRRMNRLRSR